ncbi:MAG: hypothetical protein AAF789_12500 [Bacteroidota bacterium]
MNSKRKAAIIGIFTIFLLLFNYPFISMSSGFVLGVPTVLFYFGVVWILLIITMVVFNATGKDS